MMIMVMVGGYVLCRLKLKWKQFRIQVINQPRRMVTHWPPPLLSTECTVRMSVVRFGRVVSGQRVCKGDPNLLNTLEYNLFAPQIRSVPSRPSHSPSSIGVRTCCVGVCHFSFLDKCTFANNQVPSTPDSFDTYAYVYICPPVYVMSVHIFHSLFRLAIDMVIYVLYLYIPDNSVIWPSI